MANPTVTFETNQGTFKAEMFEDAAPKTAGNFLKLARDGFYDGIVFHRVIDGFMAQTGDVQFGKQGGDRRIKLFRDLSAFINSGIQSPCQRAIFNRWNPKFGGQLLDAQRTLSDSFDHHARGIRVVWIVAQCHGIVGRVRNDYIGLHDGMIQPFAPMGRCAGHRRPGARR